MKSDTRTEPADLAAVPEDEDALAWVHRELVGIHASMVEATRDDTTTLPWATTEIMGVIRYISAVRKARRAAAESATSGSASGSSSR